MSEKVVLETTKEALREVADSCPDMKNALTKLFPQYFTDKELLRDVNLDIRGCHPGGWVLFTNDNELIFDNSIGYSNKIGLRSNKFNYTLNSDFLIIERIQK